MPWEPLIEQAESSLNDPSFDERERDYKLEIAKAIRSVLETAREDGDWQAAFTAAVGAKYEGADYTLSNWRQHQWLARLDGEALEAGRAALAAFLDETKDELERFRSFSDFAVDHGGDQGSATGAIVAVGSVFNFGVQPDELFPVRVRAFGAAEKAAGVARPSGDPTAVYSGHLKFARSLRDRLDENGIEPRDMLDVQSVIWEFSNSPGEGVLQDLLESILKGYEAAREGSQLSREHPIWRQFEKAQRLLSSSDQLAAIDSIEVKFSVGQGNWAKVPWIAFLDRRETTTTQHGVYPVYLFRQDGSGVYLTLGQGVSEPKANLGKEGAYKALREKAESIREYGDDLEGAGFKLDGNLDLRSDPGLGRDYEASIAAHKLYETGQIPTDEELLADLGTISQACNGCLGRP